MSERIKVLVTAPFDIQIAKTLEKDFDMVLCEPVDEAKSLTEHPQRDHLSDTQVLVAELDLVDYKVRILDGGMGTGAVTRVLIETAQTGRRWTTVGVSENVIAASWLALEDAISYGLLGKST